MNPPTNPTSTSTELTIYQSDCLSQSSSSTTLGRKVSWLSEDEGLPLELWYQILTYLKTPEDLRNMSRTCKELYALARRNPFWNSKDKIFGNLEVLEQDRRENQSLLSHETKLKNAQNMIIESIKPESKSPSLETLLLFSSVREWILTKLPHVEKDIQNAIITALYPILEKGRNPWVNKVPFKPSESTEKEKAVLAYLETVLALLKASISLEDWDRAFILGYPVMNLRCQELLSQINSNREKDYAITLPFVQKSPSNLWGLSKMRFIKKAIERGNLALVDALTQDKENLNLTDSKGYSALERAILNNKPKIVNLLLQKGALFSEQDFLHAAEYFGGKVFKPLYDQVSKKQNPFQDICMYDVFERALRNEKTEVLEFLISKGIKSRNSSSLLHQACYLWVYPNTVKFFINAGYDIEAQDKDGQTPLFFAVSLMKYPCKQWSDSKTEKQQIEKISILLAHKANANARNKSGESVLSKAVKSSSIETVKLLLNYGADPALEQDGGKKALLLAVRKGEMEVVRKLYQERFKEDALAEARTAKQYNILTFLHEIQLEKDSGSK